MMDDIINFDIVLDGVADLKKKEIFKTITEQFRVDFVNRFYVITGTNYIQKDNKKINIGTIANRIIIMLTREIDLIKNDTINDIINISGTYNLENSKLEYLCNFINNGEKNVSWI